MQKLVKATGVPKSTILHYLHAGLLPRPVKTGRNMAYYDPACVERLRFIKLMQRKHRLDLAAIRDLLAGAQDGGEVMALMELNAAIFGWREDREFLDEAAFCQVTGLSREQVDSLIAGRMLLPLEPDRFDQEDVAVGRILKAGLDQGLTLADCTFYPRLADQMVDEEMALRRRLTADLPFERDAALTLALTRAARALRAYVIDRIFQHRVMATKGLKDHDPRQD
jgi:DNA-binding transcriptional MerR regulator